MTMPLLEIAERVERPRKDVRKVSRRNIQALRESGQLSDRLRLVVDGLQDCYTETGEWPTPAELTRWLYRHERIPRESKDIVAPRISDLVNGEWTTRRDAHGQRVRVRLGGGVCELLPARTCAVSGGSAHPIRLREAGSVLDRFGYGSKT